MKIEYVSLKNYTVFENQECIFSPGINVFIGKNGTGKTHLMKLLYAAGVSANGRNSFADKLVRTMLPIKQQINRLITRKPGNHTAEIRILAKDKESNEAQIILSFNNRTKKWGGDIQGTKIWEDRFSKSNLVFIPAKEILSNSYNLNAAVERGNVQFDDTYLDILNAAKIDISVGRDEKNKQKMLREIEKIIGGKVVYDASQDLFFLRVKNSKQEFNLVSEGIRKLSLLWILVKNGALDSEAVLFWDEPEANINPSAIPVIVKLILALEEHGIQIFISTHDYFLCKYLDIYAREKNKLKFHSFYKEKDTLCYEAAEKFTLLSHNDIMTAFISLYRKEVEVSFDE